MTIKSGAFEQYESYSQFSSLKEFNNHMEMWLTENKRHFSKGELVGLKRLVRFSAKIPGVCHAKIGTMLKAIHEEYHNNGISRSTFKRMLQKAKKLGIIIIYETERKNGSQSSNLYVFNRFPHSEPPKQKQTTHHKAIYLFKTTNNIKNTKRIEEPQGHEPFDMHIIHNETSKNNDSTPKVDHDFRQTTNKPLKLDYTYTNDRVPKDFVNLVKCFYNDAELIEEYWKMTQIAAYRHQFEKNTTTVLDVATTSFKQLVSKLKATTHSLKKPIAYFFGILNNKFEELYFEELFAMGFGSSRSSYPV